MTPVRRIHLPSTRRASSAVACGFVLAAVLLAGSSTAGTAIQDPATYAMADIHGDYASAAALLEQVGLIDDEENWTGGDQTFIQTGDYTARGPEVRRVLDLLMKLQKSEPDHVIVLLGNHEMMNLMGDLSDVTEPEYASFVDDRSEERRQEALREFIEFESDRRSRLDLPEPAGPEEQAWLRDHPQGFVEHRRAFSAEGTYGQWLRQRPVVLEYGDAIFMHAGIHPELADLSVDDINDRVRDEVRAFDTYFEYLTRAGIILPTFTLHEMVVAVREELAAAEDGHIRIDADRTRILNTFLGIGNWLSMHPDGVLWFRGYSQWSDEEGAPLIEQLTERYGVGHFVVGHTPQVGGQIRSRFEERVYLIDTGMLTSSYPGGRASVLEIRDGMFRSIYLEASPDGSDSPAEN